MKLAINYSIQAAELLSKGSIQLDRFKCPDWPDMIAEASELLHVAVHFNLKAGGTSLADTNWQEVERLLEKTRTPYVNLHLNPTTKSYPGLPVETSDQAQRELVTDRMIRDVNIAVAHFGGERVIVENVAYRGRHGKVLRPAVEPGVIAEIVSETGCGFLLDISHARISAHHLGMDDRDYMSRLPINILRELHFTGLHNLDGFLQDHLPVLDNDWPVLDWVLGLIRERSWANPWLLAFEYGGVGGKFEGHSEAEVIAEQVPQLYERIQTFN